MRPRLDLRAGINLEDDVDGVRGRRDKTYVELVLRYNLYSGEATRQPYAVSKSFTNSPGRT